LSASIWDPEGTVPMAFKRLLAHVASRSAGCQYCMAHTACGIRGKAANDSDGRRPPNPIQSGHRFRSKAATLLMG
jgi:hypothetical protein